MTRLAHSNAGFLRYMQMSRAEVFVFVEGKTNDPYFYRQLVYASCQARNLTFQLCTAEELPTGGGGKQRLLAMHDFLRRKGSLLDDFAGKRTLAAFFLDRDLDQFLRTQRRSAHIIYTEGYEIENTLYQQGDFAKALEACSSLDPSLIQSRLGASHLWMASAATRWKDWVLLCFFARRRGVNCESNYGSPSRINSPQHGATDATALRTHMSRLRKASSLKGAAFARAFRADALTIDRLYASGRHDLVFRGKWYSTLLGLDVRDLCVIAPANTRALGKRMETSLLLTLDFSAPWAKTLAAPFEALLQMAEPSDA